MSRGFELSRRALLRAFGGTALAYPFLNLLEGSRAFAANAGLQNLIVIYHPHGISAEYWSMQAADTESAFDLGYANCSLQPLDDAATYGKSYKDKLLLVDHLSNLSEASGHDSAATITTGSKISGGKPLNSSIEQYLAVEKGLGSSTPITSVALGVGDDATDSGNNLSFGPGGAPLAKIIDPTQTFKTLFAALAASADPAQAAALARKNTIDKSILDFTAGQLPALKARLGAAEGLKVDQHLESIRQIEKRLTTSSLSCSAPPTPDAKTYPKIQTYNGGPPYFDIITDLQMDMMAEAIACGITRFATMFLADLSYAGNPLSLPIDNHGSVAHTYNASPVGNNNRPNSGDPSTQQLLAKLNKYYYGKLAALMQKLDQLGGLDNTLIYMSSDMGNPNAHTTWNTPTVLAGGAGGKFRMGRRLKMPFQCPSNDVFCDQTSADFQGTSNAHLLVSIANAFGVATNTFGTQTNPANATGPLSGLV